MTEKVRSLIIPDITEGEPEVRKLMPTVGELPARQTYYGDLEGLQGAFPQKPELKPITITPEHLSAILNALATHGEG